MDGFQIKFKLKDELITKNLFLLSGDTLIWQTFASVILPRMTINMIVKLSINGLN